MNPRGVNLHPSDHLPAALAAQVFDVVVIGSGPAGRALAKRTQKAGLRTLIVEKELFGGDCPFWACIPSKALLRPAEALNSARELGGARELISNDSVVDVQAVFGRRDLFTQKWNDKFLVDVSESQDCTIVRGTGRLKAEKLVEVTNVNGETTSISAKYAVVLATGSQPTMPGVPGLAELRPWTPRDATAADHVPKHLVILGGGVVGCEMATAYAAFGARVTLISSSSGLLPRFELEAGRRVLAALKSHGVVVHLSTTVKSFEKEPEGTFQAILSSGSTVEGSTLLVAAGRQPDTSGIGLEELGLDPSAICVDDSLCVTSFPERWLYAIGDSNARNPLTHMGVYQARAASLAIIEKAKFDKSPQIEPWAKFAATADHEAVSQVVMTDPNIASSGLTSAEASKRGKNVKLVEVPFQFPGAWVHAEFNYDGWAQWVIDVDKHVLVGATFIGREAADLLYASTVAITAEVPIERLWHAVPSFPTMSEIYLALLTQSGY